MKRLPRHSDAGTLDFGIFSPDNHDLIAIGSNFDSFEAISEIAPRLQHEVHESCPAPDVKVRVPATSRFALGPLLELASLKTVIGDPCFPIMLQQRHLGPFLEVPHEMVERREVPLGVEVVSVPVGCCEDEVAARLQHPAGGGEHC